MKDDPDTRNASVTPHHPGEDRPAVVDDTIAEDRAIPLSVATGEEPGNAPGVVSEDQVKLALRRVKDPDLNLNILDMGLVYGIEVKGTKVKVDMTLTSPGCPSGPEIMMNAEQEIKSLSGVESVEMNLVWMPFWTPEKMEPRVRAYLGF
jgi:Predicted metal-sulfur cluster biosynthetic enzyme